MSRALRRAEDAALNRFKRQAGGALITFCGEPAALGGHPHEHVFRRAVGDLYHRAHSLTCIICREALCTQRPISAVLLACRPRSPSSVSASAICLTCWSDPDYLTLAENAGERILGRIVANGKFEPMQKQTARSGMPGGP